MRRFALAAGLLIVPACGEVPDDPATPSTVRVVGLDALAEELPRVLGKGALVNLWAMW